MTLLEKFKSPNFWTNVLRIALPFLILVTIISLFMNSWRDIFAGDFEKVNEVNFANEKWRNFWSFKIVLSFVYALYVVLKKTK
jgi:hypothetical protein